MFDLSHWSEIANVLYIPALFVMYGGWIIRFFQKWYAVMKWPDILLLCFGIGVFTVMAVPKFAPYFAPQTVMVSAQAQAPVNSLELTALRTENAKLKAENVRLRKLKPSHIAAASSSPIPSASPTSAPNLIQSSKISMQDCEDLTGAQKLVDSADYDRVQLSGAESTTEQGRQRYNAAVSTENQALGNLASLEARLCAGERL